MSSIALFSDLHNYYLYAGWADMRKSFDGLSGIILNELGRQLNEKDVFIFLNKDRNHVKVLLYEADGFTLLHRRLHKGRFTLPAASPDAASIQLSAIELISLLQGLHLHSLRKTGASPHRFNNR
jgi:transposase